jgi:hypothetical protein
MPSIKDLSYDKPTTTLLKGPTGFGKTIAAASYPEPVYIFDFDGRVDSVGGYYTGARHRDIRFDMYGAWNLFQFLDEMNDLLDKATIKVDGEVMRPGTIVVDSVTHLSIAAVEYQLGNVKDAARKDKTKTKKTQGGIVIPDWDEYKGETSVFNEVLGIIKALPKRHGIHTIATAHPTKGTGVSKNAEGKVEVYTKVAPIIAIGSKAADITPTAFNEVYHFALRPGDKLGDRSRRIVYTEAAGDESAKTTLQLPVVFEWTNELFYDKLMELAKLGESIGGDWDALKKEETKKASGW